MSLTPWVASLHELTHQPKDKLFKFVYSYIELGFLAMGYGDAYEWAKDRFSPQRLAFLMEPVAFTSTLSSLRLALESGDLNDRLRRLHVHEQRVYSSFVDLFFHGVAVLGAGEHL